MRFTKNLAHLIPAKKYVDDIFFWIMSLLALAFFLAALRNIKWAHYHIYQVGYNYWGWVEKIQLLRPDTNPLFFIETLMYGFFTLLVGHVFLKQILNVQRYTSTVKALLLLAGFVPGYLMLIAINRLITSVFANDEATGVLGTLCIGGIICYFRALKNNNHPNDSGSFFIISAFVTAVLAVSFIFSLQLHNAHGMGDSLVFYLNIIKNQTQFSSNQHFPVIMQHYDEILYLYPILQHNIAFASSHMGNVFNAFWIMYTFGKASCFCIIILSTYALSNSRLLGLLLALLFFIGTIHPIPIEDFQLFDSNKPLMFNFHIGRVILSLLPFAILAIISRYGAMRPVLSFSKMLSLVLIGIGLSALSLHFISIVILSGVMAFFFIVPASIYLSTSIIAFSMLSITALYAHLGSPITIEIGIVSLITTSLLITLHLLRTASAIFLNREAGNPSAVYFLGNILPRAGLVLTGIALGLCFFGNSLVHTIYSLLHFSTIGFLTRETPHSPLQFGASSFCGATYMLHCLGFASFVKHFGLPFIIAAVSAVIALEQQEKPSNTGQNTGLLAALAVAVASLTISFFIYDFMNGGPYPSWLGIWIKSRLPEPWFYCCIGLGTVLLWLQSTDRWRWLLIAVLLLYIIFRNVVAQKAGILGQMYSNVLYLYEHLETLYRSSLGVGMP